MLANLYFDICLPVSTQVMSMLSWRTQHVLKHVDYNNVNILKRLFTTQEKAPSRGLVKMSLLGIGIGAVVGTGYSFHQLNKPTTHILNQQTSMSVLKNVPNIVPTRKVSLNNFSSKNGQFHFIHHVNGLKMYYATLLENEVLFRMFNLESFNNCHNVVTLTLPFCFFRFDLWVIPQTSNLLYFNIKHAHFVVKLGHFWIIMEFRTMSLKLIQC